MRQHYDITAVVFVICLTCAMPWAHAQDANGIQITKNSSVSPFIEGTATYDSNVPLAPSGEEQDDFFFDLIAGLSFIRSKEASDLNIRGWYQIRRYLEFDSRDSETWQENVEWVKGHRDRVQMTLKQRHGELDDYEFTQSDIGAVQERHEAATRLIETRTRRTHRISDDISLTFEKDTRFLLFNLGGSYAAIDFDTADSGLYGWNEMHLDPYLGFRFSEKSAIGLSGEIGQQTSDNSLDCNYYRYDVRFSTKVSEKTDLQINAGLQTYDYSQTEDEDVEDLDTTVFHYGGRATWAVTEKWTLQVYGRNEIVPTSAYAANTKQTDQGSVGLTYDITRGWFSSLGVSFRRDDYTRPVNGVDAVEDLLGAKFRLQYASRKRHLHVYAQARYEEFTSNIQEDYDQLRLSLGASLAF